MGKSHEGDFKDWIKCMNNVDQITIDKGKACEAEMMEQSGLLIYKHDASVQK